MGRLCFDYSKLRGRIREVCGTQEKLANALGITDASVSMKLCNKRGFDQDDIYRMIDILHIDPGEVTAYFFTLKL